MKLKRAAAIFSLIVPATLFAQPTQVPVMPTQPRAPAPPAMPPPTVQTGATWNEWDAARRLGYVEGFKSGTLWVASTSIVPPFAFKNEAVRSQAQKIWEQAKEEYGNGLANPKTQLPSHEYTALHMMMFGVFDRYQRNAVYERAIIKVPAQAIVERMDRLYAEPDNMRMPLNAAIFLANKMANDASEEDVNALLPYLRGEKPTPPGGKIPVYGKDGKPTRYVDFP